MQLLRPIPYKTEHKIIINNSQNFEYTDPIFQTKTTKSINVLTIGEFGYNKPTFNVDLSAPNEEKLIIYAGMQSLIKSCVDNAEDIKSALHQLYTRKKNPQSEDERKEVAKIDFMKLRDWYMNDIRSSKIYQEFSKYNSTKKLKHFSTAFYNFIMDRNIYTHGILCIVKPHYDFVIQYTDSESHRQKIATIDLNILQSYNDTYLEIKSVMTEYNIIYQNRLQEANKKQN